MVFPGVSDRKYPWRLEDNLDSGFNDKEDLRPVTSQLKKGSWQVTKGLELLQKWLTLKLIAFWHLD